MNEVILLESESLRQQLCTDSNTSLLEKIGQLIFLPGMSCCSAYSIAEFYQVDLNTLQQVIKRHRMELEEDGYKLLSKKELENVQAVHFGGKIPNNRIAQQLDDQAGQLIQHADCFANQANKLKKHFEVTRYKYLPKAKFREILDWLETQKIN